MYSTPMRYVIFVILLFLLSACKIANSSDENSSLNDSNNIIDNSINIEEPNEFPGMDSSDGGDSDNPFCDGINTPDGPGNFLWKPVSESDGNLVILFPSSFNNRFLSVLAFKPDGTAESGSFTGFTNGSRQTWRFDSPGEAYSGRILVDDHNQECIWEVPNPAGRND